MTVLRLLAVADARVILLALLGSQRLLQSGSSDASCEDDALGGVPVSPASSLIQRLAGRQNTAVASSPGFSQRALPTELVELGNRIFGNQSALDDVMAQSSCSPMSYADVKMQICIAGGDDAKGRLPGENGDGYGLDTLSASQSGPGGLINVVDMGGNYGVVTIAIVRKYPGRVRAVVAEPVPATYFFLRWNMHLNGVTVLDEDTFIANEGQPVVAALHKGVSGAGETSLRICSPPWSTMNAYLSPDPVGCTCNEAGTICNEVESIAADRMLNMVGPEDISLLKLDCEGCEKDSLPVIASGTYAGRIKRLVGELHNPDPPLVELACQFHKGEFLTAFCRGGVGRVDGPEVCSKCNVW